MLATEHGLVNDSESSDNEVSSEDIVSYGERIRRKRIKSMRNIILGVIILLIAQAVFIMSVVGFMFSGGEVYETDDISKYGEFDGHIETEDNGRFSRLLIFPESITSPNQNVKYKYIASNKGLDNEYLIYLDMTMSEKDYASEKERLENITVKYKDKVNKMYYTELNFNYPALVSVFNDNGCYEYALLDEENHRIIYVYSQFKSPDAYLRDNDLWALNEKVLLYKGGIIEISSYSIYYFRISGDSRVRPN